MKHGTIVKVRFAIEEKPSITYSTQLFKTKTKIYQFSDMKVIKKKVKVNENVVIDYIVLIFSGLFIRMG